MRAISQAILLADRVAAIPVATGTSLRPVAPPPPPAPEPTVQTVAVPKTEEEFVAFVQSHPEMMDIIVRWLWKNLTPVQLEKLANLPPG